jgi:serine phosphatase RsbU (regulator of sigma subunit)
MEKVGRKLIFAVADCTGHGVPGAMVSLVCNSALNRSVREYGLTIPGEILDKTREIILEEFAKDGADVKDGMDIALVSLVGDNSGHISLQYAGAHNSLWLVRKNATELEEIKANKQPIGYFDHQVPFSTHDLTLQTGDQFYLYSDGYADQFGGERGKKFKAANLKKLLIANQNLPMQMQLANLDEVFENWRGALEQLDDVCLIGVRL